MFHLPKPAVDREAVTMPFVAGTMWKVLNRKQQIDVNMHMTYVLTQSRCHGCVQTGLISACRKLTCCCTAGHRALHQGLTDKPCVRLLALSNFPRAGQRAALAVHSNCSNLHAYAVHLLGLHSCLDHHHCYLQITKAVCDKLDSAENLHATEAPATDSFQANIRSTSGIATQ